MSVPQRIAAIPHYLPSHSKAAFVDAAAGHKFLGYFRNWQGSDGTPFAPYKGKARVLGSPPSGQARRDANDRLKAEFDGVLNEVCELGSSAKLQIAAIRARQQVLHTHHGHGAWCICAISTAPFATGLGNEHPIENGFAFLTPYGLPYLAGSGVKGILRRAMQELRADSEDGFTDATIDALFGPENIDKPEDARRGALDFWDVFPQPKGDKLTVEIMTPHYGEYYRGNQSPHDSGAPVPVSFLAVPAGSAFDFHVVCHATRLHEDLRHTWKHLLERAFKHAFDWGGFGAKTSVGYGAMLEDPEAQKQKEVARRQAESDSQALREQAEREALQASLSPQAQEIEKLRQKCEELDARITGGNFKKHSYSAGNPGPLYQEAAQLVNRATTASEWSAADKQTLVAMLEQWLPKVIAPWDAKEQRKKLKFALLQGKAQ